MAAACAWGNAVSDTGGKVSDTALRAPLSPLRVAASTAAACAWGNAVSDTDQKVSGTGQKVSDTALRAPEPEDFAY
jgi:hypothetical protein